MILESRSSTSSVSSLGFWISLYTTAHPQRRPLPDFRRLRLPWNMSSYENVVGGKLKLKGKALDVKAGGVKKKKKQKKHYDEISQVNENELSAGGNTGMATDLNQDDVNDANKSAGEGNAASYDEHLTPAERRYMEQKEQIDVHRLAKISNKSHRDRILDFNQYLANMSEHYDIPKVGPG
ncbi:unnamed protein product [Camellia sinensis]